MQQEENQFDVIIVGAGPAGSAAAIALSKSELKVALVDKYDFPRDKTCGDVIPGPTFKALDYLGVDFSNELKSMQPQFPIKQTAVISTSGKRIAKTWKQFAYNAKRLDFDNKLLQLALKNPNISFLPKSKITTINRRDGKVFCTTSNQLKLTAPIIIGCDGANSVVKRTFAENETSRETVYTAVRQYHKGLEITPFLNEIYLSKKYPKGYFWVFPVSGEVCNVGFGIHPDKKNKINVKEAFKDILENDKVIAPLFKNAEALEEITGAPLPVGGRENDICGDNFMLCGDAASLIDPLSGAGIDNAVWSGIFAAEQSIKAFESKDFSAQGLKAYQERVHSTFTRRLAKNYRTMRFVTSNPKLANFLIGVLQPFVR